MKRFLMLSVIALAACGGGAGGSGVTPGGGSTIPLPTPSPSLFVPSGKPMSLHIVGDPVISKAVRAQAVPLSASPTPTPTPFPTPFGNPQLPKRVVIANGYDLVSKSPVHSAVLDPNTNAIIPEPSPPTAEGADIPNIGLCCPSADPSTAGTWAVIWQTTGLPFTAAFHIAVSYPDSVGVINAYSYDGFDLSAQHPNVSVSSGVAADSTQANADFYLDAAGVHLPKGIQLISPPSLDYWGDPIPALNDLLTCQSYSALPNAVLTTSDVQLALGSVYQMQDSNGVTHKFMFTRITQPSQPTVIEVYQLASTTSGGACTYPF